MVGSMEPGSLKEEYFYHGARVRLGGESRGAPNCLVFKPVGSVSARPLGNPSAFHKAGKCGCFWQLTCIDIINF